MLSLFEAYPQQLSQPHFQLPASPASSLLHEDGGGNNATNSSSSLPDWLVEAMWDVRFWVAMQEEDGAVRGGTEADAHPGWGDNAATDPLRYRTFARSWTATALCAGMFAQASRLLAPFDQVSSAALLSRALRAWAWAVTPPQGGPAAAGYLIAPHFYAAGQLYLSTGDPAFHQEFISLARPLLQRALPWPQNIDLYIGLGLANGEAPPLPCTPATCSPKTPCLNYP